MSETYLSASFEDDDFQDEIESVQADIEEIKVFTNEEQSVKSAIRLLIKELGTQRKMTTIKIVRAFTQMGLKECKDLVEEVLEESIPKWEVYLLSYPSFISRPPSITDIRESVLLMSGKAATPMYDIPLCDCLYTEGNHIKTTGLDITYKARDYRSVSVGDFVVISRGKKQSVYWCADCGWKILYDCERG